MLDILTIVHTFADAQTASRIRRLCRRLCTLLPIPKLRTGPHSYVQYEYRIGGKLHRLDGPALEYIEGDTAWYREGREHREYHPQYISRRYRIYVVNKKIHRDFGPSLINMYNYHIREKIVHGTNCRWYFRGLLHRKSGPAVINRETWWYTLGELHRLDAPARSSIYYIRGIRHRISGPMNGGQWVVDRIVIRE